MNEEIEKLYGVLTRDGYYSKSIEEFKVKWQDESYKKKVYDVVKRDNLYTKDYNSFVSKYSPSNEIVKKKEPTELPSSSIKAPSLSDTSKKAKPAPSESSTSKDDGIYEYSGRKGAIYKKQSGKWLVDTSGTGKFIELKDPEGTRSSTLNKQAKKIYNSPFEDKNLAWSEAPSEVAKTPVSEDQAIEQKVFASSFKALDKNDPIVKERELKEKELNSILSNFSDKNVGNLNEDSFSEKANRLLNSSDLTSGLFNVSPTGAGYNAVTITNKLTGEKRDISLKNWSSERDNDEAKILKAFVEVNSKFADLSKMKSELNKLEEGRSSMNTIDRIEVDQKISELKKSINIQNKLRNNYALSDKYRAAAVFNTSSVQEAKDKLTRLQLQSIDVSEEQKELDKYNQDLLDAVGDGRITRDEYDKNYLPKIKSEQENITYKALNVRDSAKDVYSDFDNIEVLTALNFAAQQDRGNILTGSAKSFMEGAESVVRFAFENTSGLEQIEAGEIASQLTPGIVTKEFLSSSERSMFEQAIFGVMNSFGAATAGMVIPGGGQVLGMYASSYMSMKDQMNDPSMSDVPEYEKILLSGTYGAVIAALEKFGIDKMLSKSPVGKNTLNWIMSNTFKSIPKNASKDALESAINDSIKTAIAKGIINTSGAALAEGATEGLQEGFDIALKEVYNSAKGKDFFEGPKSITEALSQIGEATALGMIGGGVMSGLNQAIQTPRDLRTASQFNEMASVMIDKNLKDIFLTSLKGKVLSGEMTKAEAMSVAKELEESQAVLDKIPESISNDKKFEAFKLINEKQTLSAEINGMDESLTVVQRERIKEINDELQQISRDAVQEQATGKVPVQPETTVGEEMEGGKPEAETEVVTEKGKEITPENSSNYANLTEDDEGNFVFYHYSAEQRDVIDPTKYGSKFTGPEERTAMGAVGGVSMYYTDPKVAEQGVGNVKHMVKVPKGEVYDFNSDPNNYIEEARSLFESENPKKAFTPNMQLAYITKVAGMNGYKMVVAEWDGKTRAQTTKPMTPSDVQLTEGNRVVKDFDKDYVSNRDKGFEPIIPEDKQKKLDSVYGKIYKERNSQQKYDGLYRLQEESVKMTQEDITNLILSSDISQELKDEYQEALSYNPEKRRSVKQQLTAVETTNATEYSDTLAEAIAEMIRDGKGLELQVSPVSQEEAQAILDDGGRIFMSSDGLGGAYVKKDGYMGGLFKNPRSKFKDVGKVLQQARVEAGGRFMEGYATKLEEIYVKNGFRPVARLKFNEEFAPEGWDAENSPLKGKPDVVFFAYDPDGKFAIGDGEYIADYDTAYEIAKNFKPEQDIATTEVTIENAEDFKRKAATESDNVNTPKIVQAAKSVMRALPGLKVHIHTTQESYLDAISKLEGKTKQQVEQDESGERRSGGTYMNGEIHIDLSAPDVTARTVYHEAFHHALLTSGKAAGDMRAMVNGIKKALGSKHAELVSKIEEFESMYSDSDGFTDMDRAEEFLSELGAVLAESSSSLDTNTLQRIANIINKIAERLVGRPIFSSNASRQEIIDFMNSMSRGMARGEDATSIINNVSNGVPIENSYIETNGNVVGTRSNRKLSLVNTVVKESDVIDTKTLEGKPLEIVYYDNYTSSEYNLTNRVSGTSVKRKGGGGPGYSYRPEIRKAGIIAAFTNVTKGLNLIQGISSRNKVSGENAVVGVALQNKETGHLGNKDTLFDFFNPKDGEIARAISDGVISSKDAVKMLKDSVTAYEQTKKGQDSKSSLGFSSKDFNSLEDFYNLLDGISFERRGTFNATVIPSKSDLKINKSTKPHVIAWLSAGIPTLSDYYIASTEAYTSSAEAHDIVKYINPDLKRIGVPKGFDVSEKEISRAKEMGVEIEFIDNSLSHKSYPVVLFGGNIGIPSTFHSVRDMSESWNESNPFFKAGRRKDTAEPVRIPKLKDTGRAPETKSDDVSKSKKRISGSNSKKQAIDDAKSKYDLSVNKRKNSHQQGVQAAIGDLQKSDWYKQADDTQREEAVREIKSFLGEKIKKAPSVAKVLGKPKDEKVTNNVRTLRNEFIKARATAAREAKADLKTKQRAIVVAVNQMKRGGFITAQQASSLAKRIVMLNVDNAVHVEKFMSFAEKIFADAEYNQKLSNAKSLNAKIKKAMKSEGNQATSAAIAKEFSKIDPKAIEDIDMYIEMAEKVLGAVKPSRVKGLDVDFKTAMDFEAVSEYVDIAMTQQEEFKKSQMLAVYSSLEADGVISDDMSLKEMMEIVASINESEEGMPSNEKAAYIMAYVSKVFDTYSPIIKSMLRGTDPFTGDSVTITDKQRDIMQRLLKINVESMDIRDAIRIIEAMDNFSTNAITDGVEAIVARYEGVMNAKSIADSGFKARETRTFGKRGQMFDSASLGRVWAQQMMTMKTLADLMFRGPINAVKVLSDIGFSAFERGVSRATKVWNTSIDAYYNSFRKKKANGKKFMDADNIIERGMYASLRRTIAGDVKAVDAELKRKIKLIADSIEVLRLKGDVNQKALADIYEQTFNKLGLGDANITAADIESRVDQVNKQAVDWWIEEWGRHYGDLVDVSENVYNTKLGKDLFYTTDRFSSVSRDASIEEAIEKAGGGGFASAVGYEYDKKTGVLMPSTKPISMGGNRFLDLNFDMNNSKALKAALVDINTAAATRQINGALSSDHWIKIIPNAKDREMFRGRVDNYILRSRNKSVGGVQGDLINTIEKSSRVWATMGASRALGGVFQPVKQVVPVALNTLINAGRLDLLTPFGSQDFHEWLDKSGLGIAGRGMESQSGFEDANRMLEDAAMSGNIAKVISSIEGASRFGLKYVLVNPDVWIARSSFKSYYIQGLKMRGESTDIDWKNHEVNVDAAQYAQHMVDRQQNVSDSALSGEFLTSSDPVRKIAKNVLFPFASFVLNQKSRMFADFSTITNRESSDQDRVSAARSLAGLATEMAVFQGISFSIRYLILNQIAQAITGHEPDDEEKEETLRGQLGYSAGTMVKDVFSPIPLTDSYAIDGAQYVFDLISNTFSDSRVDAEKALIEYNESLLKSDKSPLSDKDAEKWIEEFIEEKKFTIREYKNNQSAGTYGITLTKFNELMSAAKLAYEGEFERETPTGQKTKKYILDKDRDNLKNLFPALAMYNIIGFPAELSGLYRNVENHAKKTKSITEKQFETYKELGVKSPSIIEEYLIRNTRATENSSAAERIKKELDRIEKWSGKLNDDQMRRYIEIKETNGDVGLRDLTEL